MAKQTKAGRHIKFDAESQKIFLDNISLGLSMTDACILAGVSDQTILNHKKTDLDFLEKVHQKEIECKRRNIGLIQKAAQKGTWQAAAWWLERKHSEEFALKTKHELMGKDGQQLVLSIDNLKNSVSDYDKENKK